MLEEASYSLAGQQQSSQFYIWLDNLPLGGITVTYDASGGIVSSEPFFLHFDHLGTPRVATNAGLQTVWAWNSDAFGVGATSGSLTINLRFPGQYYDQESGLHYNYFRDYDPETGRYVESDPIGLGGGLNTYGYVGGNPLAFSDPDGLFARTAQQPLGVRGVGVMPGMGGLITPIGAMYPPIGPEVQPTLAPQSSPVGPSLGNPEQCGPDYDPCGPYTRSQALRLAQETAQIPRKNRNYISFDDINQSSLGNNCSMLMQMGATHAGYSCQWNRLHRIEDHPDGHPHLPGDDHHSCPHIHVYVEKGETLAIITYKRG